MLANFIDYSANLGYALANSAWLLLANNTDGAGDGAAAGAAGAGAGAAGAGAAGPAGPEPSLLQQILGNPMTLFAGVFLIFYLTFLAPERRKRAEEAKLMNEMKKNDRVITIGGIHGTIVSVTDGVVTLKLDEGGSTRIKINQSAIATKIDPNKEKGQANKDGSAAKDKS